MNRNVVWSVKTKLHVLDILNVRFLFDYDHFVVFEVFLEFLMKFLLIDKELIKRNNSSFSQGYKGTVVPFYKAIIRNKNSVEKEQYVFKRNNMFLYKQRMFLFRINKSVPAFLLT